ncbi:MAG: hypothetical protein CH6_4097 [Candidatus Kapaibacterium sp.]|nr:MAG: hypothetical protein CH6_4097 [Candidatus Kapabacteria bacterium]
MKILKLTLVLFIANVLWLYSFEQNALTENLVMKRVGVDFLGAVSNGTSILVYGKGGIILRSIDGGSYWERIVVADSLDIVGIVSTDFRYFGITSTRWGIYSYDNGKRWNFVDLGNYNFYQLLKYKNYLVALSESKVFLFDQNFNKLKEFDYSTDNSYFGATISGNKIFCSSGQGKITMIDLDNGIQQEYRLSDFGICSDCPVVKNLVADSKGKVFFQLDAYLFVFDTQKSKMDTLAFLQSYRRAKFNVFNDEIYYIYTRQIASVKDTFFFHRIDQNTKKYVRIDVGPTERYISNLTFTDLAFISKDTIVAVGKNNLIYMSYNGGINWELKSFLGGYFYVNVFDKDWRAIGPYSTFYYSANDGVTWLPTRSFYREFNDNYKFQDPRNSKGFLYFKDKNNGVYYFALSFDERNVVYTKDGGENLLIKSTANTSISADLNTFAIENKNKYLLFQWGCLNWNLGCWSSFRLVNDTIGVEWNNAIRGTQMFFATKYDNKIYTIAKDSSEPEDVYTIYFSQDDGNNWTKDFTFKIEKPIYLNCLNAVLIDNSIFATWNKLKKVGQDSFVVQVCYQIDLINKTAKKLIETKGEETQPSFFKIKGRYFFKTSYLVMINNQITIVSNLFYTNDISGDNIVWDTVSFNNYSFGSLFQIFGDTALVFSLIEKDNQSVALFYAKIKESTSSVVEELNQDAINSIYISRPIPHPMTTDKVSFKIYWDQRLDIETSNFSVYNILGEKVSNESEFTLVKKNNYSGELFWSPKSKLPPGVYFVSCSVGTNRTGTILVVN